MKRGKLIVIEGIDGAGKTTQTDRLAGRMFSRLPGCTVVTTRQPTGSPMGALLRKVLDGGVGTVASVAIPLLFAADRLDMCRMIKPMLAEGRHVVSDRYSLSNICYQVALAEQHDGLKAAREMYDWLSVVEWKATRPDLTIVLRLPVEEAARRRAERGKAATLYENDGLLAKVAGMYDREAEEMARAGQRVAIVDATGSVEETAEKVWAEVARLFER